MNQLQALPASHLWMNSLMMATIRTLQWVLYTFPRLVWNTQVSQCRIHIRLHTLHDTFPKNCVHIFFSITHLTLAPTYSKLISDAAQIWETSSREWVYIWNEMSSEYVLLLGALIQTHGFLMLCIPLPDCQYYQPLQGKNHCGLDGWYVYWERYASLLLSLKSLVISHSSLFWNENENSSWEIYSLITGEDHIFSVTPNEMDIPPLKSSSFRVSFRPVSRLSNRLTLTKMLKDILGISCYYGNEVIANFVFALCRMHPTSFTGQSWSVTLFTRVWGIIDWPKTRPTSHLGVSLWLLQVLYLFSGSPAQSKLDAVKATSFQFLFIISTLFLWKLTLLPFYLSPFLLYLYIIIILIIFLFVPSSHLHAEPWDVPTTVQPGQCQSGVPSS